QERNGILRAFPLSFLFAVLISTVNFQFDVFAKVRCTQTLFVVKRFQPPTPANSPATNTGPSGIAKL
ncbi:hypothetical protein K4039_11390, partial [Lyngbya sp. CCAP 1446/10]|uniref:hypothetical protein n=1 Tax=Lyngbya sp. CCAP 1446/10 TaxID=439293 RepID=UPI002237E6F0